MPAEGTESTPIPAQPRPTVRALALDVLGWAFGLGLAWHSHWQTRDLVWSLWLCSLCIGYASLLSILGAGIYLALQAMADPSFKREESTSFVLVVSAVVLFLLAFFSVHFCGFHSIHASILSGFFPPPHPDAAKLGDTFINPPKLIYLACRTLLPAYGWILASAALAEREQLLGPFIKIDKAIAAARRERAQPESKRVPRAVKDIGDPFFAPYKNVLRLHGLLFFFAFAHFAGLQGFPVFAVAYSVYFFPWAMLRAARSQSHAAPRVE